MSSSQSPQADNGGGEKGGEDKFIHEREFERLTHEEVNGDADEKQGAQQMSPDVTRFSMNPETWH